MITPTVQALGLPAGLILPINTNYSSSGAADAFRIEPEKFQDNPILEEYYKQHGPDLEKTIEQVQAYLDRFNLRENTAYQSDLAARDYVEVAIQYRVPIRQMLAVGRLESHFGTNCNVGIGVLSRPCMYKNPFSIGLTQSSSMGFSTWREGLEAFGKWYRKYDDRGYSDEQKWRIFNPNGDYATKVLNLANSIPVQDLIY